MNYLLYKLDLHPIYGIQVPLKIGLNLIKSHYHLIRRKAIYCVSLLILYSPTSNTSVCLISSDAVVEVICCRCCLIWCKVHSRTCEKWPLYPSLSSPKQLCNGVLYIFNECFFFKKRKAMHALNYAVMCIHCIL